MSKEVTVLTELQSTDRSTQDLHIVLLQHASVFKGNTAVQSTLTTEGKKNTVGLLLLNDVLDVLRVDGNEVNNVGKLLAGLNGGDVGVDENRLNTFLLQGFDGLGTCESDDQ